MKFKIELTNDIRQSIVKYISEEFSFDNEPKINETDFDLAYNRLNLTVVDEQVVQIWGYAGDVKKLGFDLDIPDYNKGVLKVEGEFEYGLSYGINKGHVPTYYNQKSGWICIGNPKARGNGVEFIGNCVAFVNDSDDLASIWIKPIIV
jgi:hypothetical protein